MELPTLGKGGITQLKVRVEFLTDGKGGKPQLSKRVELPNKNNGWNYPTKTTKRKCGITQRKVQVELPNFR